MYRTKISGVGHYVPENIVKNEDLEKLMNTSDDWIRERTGIQERRFFNPDKDTVANMSARAANMAINRAGGIDVKDIDFIVLATITPDYFFPGSGALQKKA